MDRLERLLNLVAALLDTERLITAEEIGRRVPGYPEPKTTTFKRAFERDKATLRAMGIPLDVVELEPGNPESAIGYRVPRARYELHDPGLEPDELAALHLAATQVRLEGGLATTAIWKLGGIPDGTTALPDAASASLPGSDHLAVLFGAVADRRTVTFPYKSAVRRVDPWRIEFRNGAWYLMGWDQDRSDRRSFRLDRIEGAPECGPAGAFAPPAVGPTATHPWEMGDADPIEVEVLVDADQAAWAIANSGAPAARRDDGSVVLRLRVTNPAGLRSWMFNFLDRAEILGPPAERRAMVEWLTAAAG
jgi:predicted DNA-binding transcriptional regulator YafY